MRHVLVKTLFREWLGATTWEKLVLILPFIVLILDLHIFLFALDHQEMALIMSSGFVLVLSTLEIIAALEEIHEHMVYARKFSSLEKKVADTIRKFPVRPTVGQVIEKMLRDHPQEDLNRYDLYPVVCEVLNNLFTQDGETTDDDLKT